MDITGAKIGSLQAVGYGVVSGDQVVDPCFGEVTDVGALQQAMTVDHLDDDQREHYGDEYPYDIHTTHSLCI